MTGKSQITLSSGRRLAAQRAELWNTSDGFDFVIQRRDRDGSRFFFVESPPSWTTAWRNASRFANRRDGERLIATKTPTSPAGPAFEARAEIVRLGPEIDL